MKKIGKEEKEKTERRIVVACTINKICAEENTTGGISEEPEELQEISKK